jgi:nucleoside phosphorylase
MTPPAATPHLVPANLIGQRFPRNTFGDVRIALVGYCPPPSILEQYHPVPTRDQYFIHVSPESVKRLSWKGIELLSLVHVYGGPVSASTVEELAWYNIDYILAYGLAGGLGTKGLGMGDFYLVETALVADGTTPHYTPEPIIPCDPALKAALLERWQLGSLHPVQAITGDAIYREDDAFIQSARARHCDIVNLDSSHLYAVSRINSDNKIIQTVECGVISDVAVSSTDQSWDSTLSAMLADQGGGALNPLERAGQIVQFYIEDLAPRLLAEPRRS